jgi:hypothetical protein
MQPKQRASARKRVCSEHSDRIGSTASAKERLRGPRCRFLQAELIGSVVPSTENALVLRGGCLSPISGQEEGALCFSETGLRDASSGELLLVSIFYFLGGVGGGRSWFHFKTAFETCERGSKKQIGGFVVSHLCCRLAAFERKKKTAVTSVSRSREGEATRKAGGTCRGAPHPPENRQNRCQRSLAVNSVRFGCLCVAS